MGQWWYLMTMPSLALCLHKEALPTYLIYLGGAIAVYAGGLILQLSLDTHYTYIQYEMASVYDATSVLVHSWPLIDPNNGACLVNILLIPCFWLALKKPKWWFAVAFCLLAIYATGSKAGITAFGAAAVVMTVAYYRLNIATIMWGFAIISVWFLACVTGNMLDMTISTHFLNSSTTRLMLWASAVSLMSLQPWIGLGLGQFVFYYNQVRMEPWTAGQYVHNDILQFAVEMGIPAALIFCLLLVQIRRYASHCVPAACVIMAVLLQSLVEFQFYIPPISMACGLALAYLIYFKKPNMYSHELIINPAYAAQLLDM